MSKFRHCYREVKDMVDDANFSAAFSTITNEDVWRVVHKGVDVNTSDEYWNIMNNAQWAWKIDNLSSNE